MKICMKQIEYLKLQPIIKLPSLTIIGCDGLVPIAVQFSILTNQGQYVRIGDFVHSLLELKFRSDDCSISELTLVAAKRPVEFPEISVLKLIDALPGLMPEDCGSLEVTELRADLQIAINSNEVVVFWQPLSALNVLRTSRVDFLLADNILVGVRIREVSKTDLGNLLHTLQGH